MNPTRVAAAFAALLALVPACTNATSSSDDSSPDAGGVEAVEAGPVVACIYQMQHVDNCYGEDDGTPWTQECQDMPCDAVVWPNDSLDTGECFIANLFQSVNEFPGTCEDWQAAGQPLTYTPPMPGAGPGSCDDATFLTGSNGVCTQCIATSCCPEMQACAPDTACGALYACLDQCDGTAGCGATCMAANAGGQAAFQALSNCVANACTDC